MPNVMGNSGRTSFGAGHGDRMSAGRAAGGRSGAGGTRPGTLIGSGPNKNIHKDPHYGLETSYGAPIRTNEYGVGVAQPAERWKSWKDQVGTYNKAAREWNDNKFLNSAVNMLAPFGLENVAPDLNRPKTYVGGTYHTGWNPAAAAGSLLGLAFPGSGIPASAIAGNLYSAAGGPSVMLGGGPVPAGWDPRGAQAADTGQPSLGPSGSSNQMAGGSTGTGGMQQLQNLAQLNQGVSGNPSAPVGVGPPGPTPTPNYAQMMASIQQVTPGYGVSLPGYQYRKATV